MICTKLNATFGHKTDVYHSSSLCCFLLGRQLDNALASPISECCTFPMHICLGARKRSKLCHAVVEREFRMQPRLQVELILPTNTNNELDLKNTVVGRRKIKF